MKKPSIAIDCDDVIVPTASLIFNNYNRTYGTKLELKDMYTKDLVVLDAPDYDTAIKRFETYLASDEYQQERPFQDAIDVMYDLQKAYDLHIITGRADFLTEATEKMLAQYFPDLFKSIELTNFFGGAKSRPKVNVCQELDVSLLIDDHLYHALTVAECGIDVLLFGNYPWNQADQLPANIHRVRDWHEVAKLLLKQN